jgi:hypothetical protein
LSNRIFKIVSSTNAATVLTEESPPYRYDENGVKILPGYRKPFAKGFDPRRFSLQPGFNKLPTPNKPKFRTQTHKAMSKLLGKVRDAIYRHTEASCQAIDADQALRRARVAKLFVDIELLLTGHNPKSHKSTKKPHLAGQPSMAKVEPIAPMVKPEPQSLVAEHPKADDSGCKAI